MDGELLFGLVRVVIVLLIMAPAVYFLTRWYGRYQQKGSSIEINEVLPMGSNKALYIVTWERRRYLLGVTSQNITLIDVSQSDQGNGEETL